MLLELHSTVLSYFHSAIADTELRWTMYAVALHLDQFANKLTAVLLLTLSTGGKYRQSVKSVKLQCATKKSIP